MEKEKIQGAEGKKSIFGKVAKWLGGFTILMILIIVSIPFLFKDRILTEVKKVINENVAAKVEFEDVGLSMFRSFPDLTLSLEGFKVDGINEFKGIRLADVKTFETRLDLLSLFSGESIAVKRIALVEPKLYVKILKNGKANYDIMIPTEELEDTTAAPTQFSLNLNQYEIVDGNLIYDDLTSDVWVDIKALNHSGSGNFTESIYDLVTTTTADKFTVNLGGVSYLNEAKTAIDFTINIDVPNSTYTFKKNEINLNDLRLKFDGFVAMPTDDIALDMVFSSPQTDFKAFLSMIPAAYTSDFSDVKASGSMAFNGVVKGIYNSESMPAIDILLEVMNGRFQYPELPMGMSDINVTASLRSPNEDFDNMILNVSKFHFELDNNPFDAEFHLKTPISDPNVEAAAKGTIDLEKLAKAFPMEGISKLNGIIKADIETRMKMSDVTAEQYEKVDLRGEMTIDDMNYVADDMPSVSIKNLNTQFTPQRINVDNFDAKLGKSDLQITGFVENPLTYFSGEKAMLGDLNIRSTSFFVDEWMGEDDASEVQHADTVVAYDNGEEGIFDAFLFNVNATFGQLVYDVYDMKNLKAVGQFSPTQFNIKQFMMTLGRSDFAVSGNLKNVFGYVFDGEMITGDVSFKSNKLDLNEIMNMGTTTSNSGEETEVTSTSTTEYPEDIFGRFDFMIDADIKEMNYDVYAIKNLQAEGHLGHKEFDITNFYTTVGKSDFSGSGRFFNMINYLYKPNEQISGDLLLTSKLIDMNDLYSMSAEEVTTTTSSTETTSESILLPDDVNLNIKASIGKILYEDLILNSMIGDMIMQDSKVSMNNVKVNMLGGTMKLHGAYDTKDAENPKFEFGYDISQFKFEESVEQLASFKYILPIAEFLKGRFNSTLTIDGVLGKDMMPKWETLNAKGLLETIEAVVKGNPTLDKIVNELNASELNPFQIKDSKNYFQIKNGKFSIEPFTLNYKDVIFEIKGSHGITQTLDYIINTKIPRALLEKSSVGSLANTGINMLNNQASKLGLNLASGDYIDLDILLTGEVLKPKYKLQLKGVSGKAEIQQAAKERLEVEAERLKEEAEQRLEKEKEALKAKAEAEADRLKAEAEAKARAEAERLKKEAEARAKAEAERLKKEAEERIKKELGEAATEAAKSEAERLKKEAQDRIDEETRKKLEAEKKKIQDQLDKYNPFKRKSSGDGN